MREYMVGSELLTAQQALNHLLERFDPSASKLAILSRVQAGALPLVARAVLEEADIGEPFLDVDAIWRCDIKSYPRQRSKSYFQSADDGEPDIPVGQDFLAESGGWTIDQSNISWSAGYLLARRPAQFKPPLKLKTRLIVSDVRRELPSSEKPSDRKTRRVLWGIRFFTRDIDRISRPDFTAFPAAQESASPGDSELEGSPDLKLADEIQPGSLDSVMTQLYSAIDRRDPRVEVEFGWPTLARDPLRALINRLAVNEAGESPHPRTLSRKLSALIRWWKAAWNLPK